MQKDLALEQMLIRQMLQDLQENLVHRELVYAEQKECLMQ